jgi:hypothetical protein
LIVAVVVSVFVCLMIVICFVMRAYLYPRNPNIYAPKTPEKKLVPENVINSSRPDEGVIGTRGHQDLAV